MKAEEFKIGDRVRLSEHGKEFLRSREPGNLPKEGTVLAKDDERLMDPLCLEDWIPIKWDGWTGNVNHKDKSIQVLSTTMIEHVPKE